MPNGALKLKPDTRLRKAWFSPEAVSHPAKGHLGLWWEILERYTAPGQMVLDPLAGIGSTLIAALLGRDVVCVEMEQHFIEPMAASWAKMQQVGPMLGCSLGLALILRGDARCLPLGSADAVVTNPPYENAIVQGSDGIDWSKSKDMDRSQTVSRQEDASGRARGYTRPVERIVTSPPYEGTLMQGKDGIDWQKMADGRTDRGVRVTDVYRGYADTPTNIGNLRSGAYWEAMSQVYRECHRVLAPGGLMVLVTKGYTRDKQYVDLPGQTAELIETLGFQVCDRWTREVPLSFWRTLQLKKGTFDEQLRFEHVVAARKVGTPND